jgi:hypothetical protein
LSISLGLLFPVWRRELQVTIVAYWSNGLMSLIHSCRVLQTARASRQPSAGTDNLSPPRLAGTKVLPLKADTAIPHGCDDRIHSFGSIGDSAGRFAVLKGEQHAV